MCSVVFSQNTSYISFGFIVFRDGIANLYSFVETVQSGSLAKLEKVKFWYSELVMCFQFYFVACFILS
jgi:hypothetical protein